MKKRFFVMLLAVALCCAPLFAGCSNVHHMVSGQWQLAGMSDNNGKMSESAMTVLVEIFEDGSVNLLDSYYGSFTIDRSNFVFEGRDGDVYYSGSFDVNSNELYIYLDQSKLDLYFIRPETTIDTSSN